MSTTASLNVRSKKRKSANKSETYEGVADSATKRIVIRKHPSEVHVNDRIAVPNRNQTLATLYNGERVHQSQRIVTITPPGTSFPMGRNPMHLCSCKNWHVTVEGSSIPQCWDRAGSIPIVVTVPDDEAIYFAELMKSAEKAVDDRLAQIMQEAHEWTTAMLALMRGELVNND